MALSQQAVELAQGPNLCVVSTLLPSGLIQTHPLWVDSDGEYILLNTEIHRKKFKNLEVDPRVTVTILVKEDPFLWSEVRGRVVEVLRGQQARDHIDALAKKYTGADEYPLPIETERAILKVAAEQSFDSSG